MIVDTEFHQFTFMNYIADGTKFTDHSELPNYTRFSYYVGESYYERTGTKE